MSSQQKYLQQLFDKKETAFFHVDEYVYTKMCTRIVSNTPSRTQSDIPSTNADVRRTYIQRNINT